MSSRQTNNSRSVSLFSETSQVSVSAGADASSHSSTASTSSPAAATFPATNVPDPAFLAAVVNAVKVALAAEKTPPSSDGATVRRHCVFLGAFLPKRIWALVRRPFFPRVSVFLHHKQLRLLLLPQVGIIMLYRPLFLPSWTLPQPFQVQCFHLALWSRLRVRAWLAPHPLLTCRLVRSCNSLLSSALAFPRSRPRPLTRSWAVNSWIWATCYRSTSSTPSRSHRSFWMAVWSSRLPPRETVVGWKISAPGAKRLPSLHLFSLRPSLIAGRTWPVTNCSFSALIVSSVVVCGLPMTKLFASTRRRQESRIGQVWTSSSTIYVLLGRRYVADLTVLLMSYLNRLERLLRRLSAGLGTEVGVPPNQPFVGSPIAAAPVVDPIALVPVLPLRIILPTGSASAGLLLLRRVRPARVPNAVEGTPSLFAWLWHYMLRWSHC